jgi:amino acid adenylation domain-containing protein/non-ribosomal peptide synthase protein (TIGR01720 family)
VIVEWNTTGAEFGAAGCVHELFEARVERCPDAVAVVFEDRRLTYGDLNARANRLARRLRRLGVPADGLVPIFMDRAPGLVTAILGALKAGAAWLPLDPAWPRDRLAFMIGEAGAGVVLSQERLRDRLPAFHGQVLTVDRPDADTERQSDANLDVAVDRSAVAYAIYTSGSTGKPKGVLVPHAAIRNHMLWMSRRFPLDAADGVVQKTPFTFDAAVWEFFAPLLAGARLILAGPGAHRDPASLVRLIAREKATVLQMVPSGLRALLDQPGLEGCRSLRRVFCGGEALRPDLVERCFERLGAELVNLYGPTEACIDSTFWICERGGRTVPIGRPIDNVRAYVLDRRLQPLPVGAAGELCVAGAGLAHGYLGRPDLTAGRFLPDPFSGEPGARLYATGDRARWLPDGSLEFLGRMDEQVKVRGYRIEPGEIETLLNRHPAVRESVVVARPDSRGDAILAAYMTLRKEDGVKTPPLPVGLLRDHLKEWLPDHMVPSAFVFLDELPRTSSGKVDRRRLPAPGAGRPDLAVPFVAPRGEDERRLAELWSRLLGLDRVGVQDGFFDLGGHSLVATQVISRVRDLFGVELPLRALFEAPTVAGLAERVAAARREGRRPESAPRSVPPDRERPLSFAQRRLWFLDQLEPGKPFYNTPCTLRLRGALDAGALEKSLNEIVRRHEVLRTAFPAVDGKPLAVVTPDLRLPLPVEDLSDRPDPERWPAALRRAREEAQAPFDLARGPLARARLLRLDARDHVLLLTFHHIVTDGWSEGVSYRELEALYPAFVEGRPSPLSPLPIQYADFAAWQRDWLRGETLDTQLAYWRRALAGAPAALDLPTDRPRASVRSHRGARHMVELSHRLSEALRSLGRAEAATPFMTVLAAFKVLLQRYTGQDDIVVGTPIANRNRLEIEGLIGFFVNTLVLRSDLSGDPTFREALRRVRGVALAAYAHQDLPFERLVEDLHPPRDLSRTALFQVMVAHAAASRLDLEGLTAEFVDIDDGISKFDLTLEVDDGGPGLACALEYSTDLFDAATARRMLRHLETLLEGVVADPDGRLSRLPVLPQEERRQVLVDWSGPRAEFPHERCIHELFEDQAARAPEAIAVCFGPDRLTYADLDRRATTLSRRLRRLGVGPESPVVLCVERSIEMVVGLLGVLKAGGAYVPLDPAYPADRCAHILEETRAGVVLTQRRLLARLRADGTRVVCLDEASVEGAAPGEAAGDVRAAAPQNLAYVIYTSGSTGAPKGVLVPHRALVNHSVEMARRYALRPDDRVLQFASLNFDVAAEEIFPTLLRGATLVLRPDPVFVSVPEFHRFLENEGVTVVNLPSSYWHAWVAELGRDERPLPACLRCVVIGSEKTFSDRLAAWNEITDVRPALFNAYGPTEATVTTTVYEAPGGPASGAARLVPIGRPIANVRVYVLDGHLNPVPVGVPGDLHVGGEGVARGYVGRPDLTAERFVPDPFTGAPGARLYRTGDRVRWLLDGNLEFLGRLDDQVKVRGYRIEPGEIERALERHPAVEESVVAAREDAPGETRLVAYTVGRPGAGPPPSAPDLRAYLKERLPEHMLPSAFVALERLPRTPSGKIDRKALPAPDAGRRDLEGGRAEPRTPAEHTLARIWSQVFGRESVGIHDNFFDLGGDSILSIQIVARANQAGLRLTSKQIFQHQTVAELAAVADARVAASAEQGAVTGEAPTTPIQRWFFEHDFADPHHFNQAVLLEARQALDEAKLERALGVLLAHHDALRMRYREVGSEWRQIGAAPGGPVPFRRIDLSALPAGERIAALEAKAAELQRSLDLAEGPLVRAALFDLGSDLPARLLVVIHHLVVDGVSWRILLEDLNTVYRQLERGDTIDLPAKTTSYRLWAERLAEHARTAPADPEIDFWLAEARRRVGRIPVDHPGEENLEETARVATSVFTEEETRALLQDVPAACRTEINDVLLTTLAQAVTGWTGERSALIDLEGHGREEVLDDVDLSRTVGWFTTIKPVLLTLEEVPGPEEALKSIKEQLRAMPARGIGYGLLRYLRGDREIARRLAALPQAEISFNYLGQFDATVPASAPFRFASESTGPVVSPRGRRTHLLEIGGYVASGRLRLSWKYSEALHARATIEALARRFERALRSLIALGSRPGAAAYTPSDFPLAPLDQATLDRLARDHARIEDVYPLTPMQEGMLYHTLSAPGSGVYVEHLSWRFHGPLDEEAFERAWRRAIERHPILRTAFVWSGVEKPLQVVQRSLRLSWERRDWRGLEPEEQERELKGFLDDDMRRGYDLSRPPQQRLAIMRLADDVHRFVWSHHHVLLDGWSLPVLLKEVASLYEAFRRGEAPALDEPVPFRDYVAWLLRQDLAAAEAYWKRALAGLGSPTPLVVDRPAGGPAQPDDYRLERIRLPRAVVARLQGLARRQQLTLNTVLQGAWAILLGRYSGQSDVLFGGVVSGRPADLRGAETMVGLMLNTLPVRARLREREPVVSWLKGLQEEQVEMRQYEYTPLTLTQKWSGLAHGTPLFESVFAFENYPLDAKLLERFGDLEVRDLRAVEWTHYPLNVVVPPGPELSIQINYDARRFQAPVIRRMLGHLRTILEGIAADPQRRLADVPMLAASERSWLKERNPGLAAPSGRCLHELFEAQAARRPEAIAVVCDGEAVTYGELNRTANRLARRLRERGAGAETRVAVCLERSIEMIEAILAILKAGAAYVPLDPAYPNDRLSFMLQDAGVVALVARQGILDRLPAHAGGVVLLEAEGATPPAAPAGRSGAAPACADDANPPPEADPDSPAYVIYTSGSTGRPKGVVVTHANATSLFAAAAARLSLDERDVWTLFHSSAFDLSVWEMWGALAHGGRLVIVPYLVSRSPEEFLDLLRRERVTVLNQTPSGFRSLMRVEEEGAGGLSLRLANFGGEALNPDDLKPWVARHPDRPLLFNLYGPTETTMFVTWRRLRPEDMQGRPRSPIGRPIESARVHLLDAAMRPVPVGVPGEICIGGAGLARGYLGRPDLTAERFVPDPFGGTSGGRLYRSGDLARWREDGDLDYLGRLDDQVKIRGFRIEPGEIESALLAHPTVREAVVVARQDGPEQRRLVAYVVPRNAEDAAPAALRAFLKASLPDYMVPSVFVALQALPVTPNGKVDRGALPAPESAASDSESARVPPRTLIEQDLARLWGGLLGVDSPGVEDNFFEAGGQSLLATLLVSRVRAHLGAEVSLKDFLDDPTIRGLARKVEEAYLRTAGPSELDAVLGLMDGARGETRATPGPPDARWTEHVENS